MRRDVALSGLVPFRALPRARKLCLRSDFLLSAIFHDGLFDLLTSLSVLMITGDSTPDEVECFLTIRPLMVISEVHISQRS